MTPNFKLALYTVGALTSLTVWSLAVTFVVTAYILWFRDIEIPSDWFFVTLAAALNLQGLTVLMGKFIDRLP